MVVQAGRAAARSTKPQPLKLEYVFSVHIYFKERLRFEPTTPMGGRVYVPVADGRVEGPRLNGRVIPHSGADWARGRSDGVAELNAHYMLQADDGTPIYLYNRGYLYGRDEKGGPLSHEEWQRRSLDGFAIKPNTYFRITPTSTRRSARTTGSRVRSSSGAAPASPIQITPCSTISPCSSSRRMG